MRKFLIIALTAAAVIFSLCSCTASPESPESQPAKEGFSEVFNDGVTVVEAGRLLRLPGSSDGYEYCFLELKITNLGTEPIYYSSMLCLRAGADGESFPAEHTLDAVLTAKASIDGFDTLDGIIEPDMTAQGFAVFEAPVGAEQFDISIATDFSEDEWLKFACGVQ